MIQIVFIITLIIVLSISEDYEAEFRKEVFCANEAFKLAYNKNDLIVGDNSSANGLEYVIDQMVNAEHGDFYDTFEKLSFVIALPDKTDIAKNITEPGRRPLIKGAVYQYLMMDTIRDELHIEIPTADEHQDNEIYYIDDDSIDYRSLDLTALGDQRRRYVLPALDNIFKRKLGSMYDHFMMQIKLEIRDTLNFGGKNLAALLEERRVSGTSLENIIRRVLGVPKQQNGPVPDVPLKQMCRYMGLYFSAQYPTSYIKRLLIDPDSNTCTLDDGTIQKKKFKKVNGVWWQISSDDGTAQLLEEQLHL